MKLQYRLTGWHRRAFGALLAMLLLLWFSGVALWLLDPDGMSTWTDDAMVWRHRSATLHGLLAWGLMLWVGRFVWPHITLCQNRAQSRARIWGGWTLLVVLLVLMLSAWGLMYGDALWHESLSSTHFWLGLFLPAPMLAHWAGPALRRVRERPATVTPKNPSVRPLEVE